MSTTVVCDICGKAVTPTDKATVSASAVATAHERFAPLRLDLHSACYVARVAPFLAALANATEDGL